MEKHDLLGVETMNERERHNNEREGEQVVLVGCRREFGPWDLIGVD